MSPVDFQILAAGTRATSCGTAVNISGRASDGRSVALTLAGQLPFLYVRLDHNLLCTDGTPNTSLATALCLELNTHLNKLKGLRDREPQGCVNEKYLSAVQGSKSTTLTWQHVILKNDRPEIVQRYDYYGFDANKKYYLKLSFSCEQAALQARFALTKAIGEAKTKMYKGKRPIFSFNFFLQAFGKQHEKTLVDIFRNVPNTPRKAFSFVLAEANIGFEHQLMEIMGLTPGGWATADLAVFQQPHNRDKEWHMKADIVGVAGVYASPVGGDGMKSLTPLNIPKSAPIRILAWDLEVYCKPLGSGAMQFFDGNHAEAKLLCVSLVTSIYGVKDSISSCVLALSNGSPVEPETMTRATDGSSVRIVWFDDEVALIERFFDFICEFDADLITGWNTETFDWNWFIQRCAALKLSHLFKNLCRWGEHTIDVTDKAWQLIQIPGRVVHDAMIWMRRNRQLREYNLQYVSTEFKLDGKDDVSYSDIDELFKTHDGRIKLAVYCELDSRLVIQLIQHKALDVLGKTLAISKLTGVSVEDQIYRGSMNTLRLAMLRASHRDDFLLSCPSKIEDGAEFTSLRDDSAMEGESRFQGASRPLSQTLDRLSSVTALIQVARS